MTTDDFFLSLYQAGCSRSEIMSSDISQLLLRPRAHERRTRREEAMTLGLRNDVAQMLSDGDADLIDPYGTKASLPNDQDRQKLDAFKHRLKEHTDFQWEEDLTHANT